MSIFRHPPAPKVLPKAKGFLLSRILPKAKGFLLSVWIVFTMPLQSLRQGAVGGCNLEMSSIQQSWKLNIRQFDIWTVAFCVPCHQPGWEHLVRWDALFLVAQGWGNVRHRMGRMSYSRFGCWLPVSANYGLVVDYVVRRVAQAIPEAKQDNMRKNGGDPAQ